ncbi:heavy-metal-associated domain-containing protein [Brevibacillus dissolubilis]|uniref:heavy-metal-associated domain-containing protein n=1 Tax=Brevibacillus dissolubilis TaxID=1844116 RepID=UPI00111647D7|nr:heavy-metal-associated domain-containing protein [Brevibacillus dissolubilis]
MKVTTLSVKGINESNDIKLVEKALYDVWGIQQVEISLGTGQVRLTYDEKAASEIDFEQAIVDQGFAVAGRENQ